MILLANLVQMVSFPFPDFHVKPVQTGFHACQFRTHRLCQHCAILANISTNPTPNVLTVLLGITVRFFQLLQRNVQEVLFQATRPLDVFCVLMVLYAKMDLKVPVQTKVNFV